MPSPLRRALTRLSILAWLPLLTAGCAATRLSPPILDAMSCASLIPPSYHQPVPGPGLLSPDATVGELATKYDGAISALDQANGRTADVIAIADACQARQRAVLDALQPTPWWQHILPHKGKP